MALTTGRFVRADTQSETRCSGQHGFSCLASGAPHGPDGEMRRTDEMQKRVHA